jgi:hypothetical protein
VFGKSYLERQNETLTTQMVEALRVSQQLNQKLADALDRVLASKFYAPLLPKPQAQPLRELFPPDLSDVMSAEDDTDFLERTTP